MSQIHSAHKRRLVRRMVTATTVTTLAATIGLATAALATGPVAAPGTSSSPAVVGPLLGLFAFGDNIGAPLVCQDVSSYISAGAAQFGKSQAVSPLVTAINDQCSSLSAAGAKLIAMGQATDSPLAAWNPILNPMLGSASSSMTMIGTNFGSALAPFGPTIAGLGAPSPSSKAAERTAVHISRPSSATRFGEG